MYYTLRIFSTKCAGWAVQKPIQFAIHYLQHKFNDVNATHVTFVMR